MNLNTNDTYLRDYAHRRKAAQEDRDTSTALVTFVIICLVILARVFWG